MSVRSPDASGLRDSTFEKAHKEADTGDCEKISDDSLLVEALGHEVAIVETDSSNIKITFGSDIAIAEAILKTRSKHKLKGPIGPYADAQW